MSACIEQIRDELLTAMLDLSELSDTNSLCAENETIFDRLGEIYLLAGGSFETLSELWPEYSHFNFTH